MLRTMRISPNVYHIINLRFAAVVLQASTCGACIACRLPHSLSGEHGHLLTEYIVLEYTVSPPPLSQVSTAIEQVEMIIGRSADAEFLDVVREMAETHDPGALLDCMRAYHFGPKFLVEVEIVMAEDTLLRDSHDCGIMLQHKIESLPEVERCFVHIDYQQREVDDHDPKAS